jgi:MFS family permease
LQGELEWSKKEQGFVLSSFFYGYVITQMPGGWLSARFGAKHVFGTCTLITLIATLFTPIAARAHVGWMIAMRVIMGLAGVSIVIC